ncbi:MAG: cobalamin B12-binding domain-containing protein [Acidimicrobiales bacterium]
MPRTYRVVVARRGSDQEQVQADAVARALRDAGFEVIYAPPSAALDKLAEAALQEDADAVVLAGGYPLDAPDRVAVDALSAALAALGLEDVPVVVGTSPVDVVTRVGQVVGPEGPGSGAPAGP